MRPPDSMAGGCGLAGSMRNRMGMKKSWNKYITVIGMSLCLAGCAGSGTSAAAGHAAGGDHVTGADYAETGVQAGDAVVGRAQILVGQGAHQQLMEVVVRLAEILDALAVVHQLGIGLQLLPGDGIAVSTQGVGLHQQTHFKHAVHVLFGDAGDHQSLFGQNGDQPLLLQPPQCIPHWGAADVAHLGAKLLLVQKLVGAVLAVQDLGLKVLVCLQLQARFGLRLHFFHVLHNSYSLFPCKEKGSSPIILWGACFLTSKHLVFLLQSK